jgi:glucose/arabinose dehydrogenase
VAALPAGEIDHHWTKGLAVDPKGGRLYVSVGSNSDHGEAGLAAEAERAAIWEIDPETGAHTVVAGGMRNPVGLAFEPESGALWTVVNERDELGGDLVPDYLTSVQRGAFYGWPFSYWGDHLDPRVDPPRPDLAATARVPDYGLGPHGAPLGLAFAAGARLGPRFTDGAFIGQHGSWNRAPQYGYRVIFVPFLDGRPSGAPLEVLTGFLGADGDARGRPAGVAIDAAGALLVADDVGNTVWRVTAAPPAQAARAIQPPPRTRLPSGA